MFKPPMPAEIIQALESRFGKLPSDLKEEIHSLTDPEDLDTLLFDIPICKSLGQLESLVHWICGKSSGRVEGLRNAVYVALGYRDDPLTESIAVQACDSTDTEELEELLRVAIRASFRFSLN